jgi:hypothetical protein
MLSACRIEAVRKSLGRQYRLVAAFQVQPPPQQQQQQQQQQSMAGEASSAGDNSQTCCNEHEELGSISNSVIEASVTSIGLNCCLNQHPDPGVYLCDVHVYLGATAHDDLLLLQMAAAEAATQSCSNTAAPGRSTASSQGTLLLLPGLHVSGSGCCAAVSARSQQVVVSDQGLELPPELMQLVASAVSSSTSANSSSSAHSRSGSSSSSGNSSSNQLDSSSSSRQHEARGSQGDPCCWDTDDNDVADDGCGNDLSAGMPALVVVDFERCLQQTCSIQSSSVSSS